MLTTMRPELKGNADWVLMQLSHAQFRVLMLLDEHGPLRMGDLSAQLGVAMPTVTSLVSKLEQKGLAVREHDTRDRRVVQCSATTSGKAEAERFWRVRQERITQVTDSLNDQELASVAEALEFMIRAALAGRQASRT